MNDPHVKNNNFQYLVLVIGTVLWVLAYNIIEPLSTWITYSLIKFSQGSAVGSSVSYTHLRAHET